MVIMEASGGTSFIILGILLLIGLATEYIGKRILIPRVTLLLLIGISIGPMGLAFISSHESELFATVSNAALMMVGFLLGEQFTIAEFRRTGKIVVISSLIEVAGTALVVTAGLILIGFDIKTALLIGAIGTATDPAATTDVVRENPTKGDYPDILLGIVAIDDAWGLIIFSFALAAAQTIVGMGNVCLEILNGLRDIGGAITVGVALGIPMAYITGRIRPGEPTLLEAMGVVFLCGGIALYFDASFILASMVMGTVVANTAKHHKRPFHAIEGIERPFIVVFFLLAGAFLELKSLFTVGVLGVAYIILRVAGRILSGFITGPATGAGSHFGTWIGLALLPQAGVAIGMTLVAVQHFPDLRETIMPVIIASTVIFELAGPIATRIVLLKWNRENLPD